MATFLHIDDLRRHELPAEWPFFGPGVGAKPGAPKGGLAASWQRDERGRLVCGWHAAPV